MSINQILAQTRLEHIIQEGFDTESIVPTPTADDNGKVLTAGADGTASWETAGSSLPSYTSDDLGKVLTVTEDAEHTVTKIIVPEESLEFENVGGPETPQYQATISSPDFSGLTNEQSVDVYVDGTGYTGTYYEDDDGNGHDAIYGNFGSVSYFLGNWLFEIGLEGEWTGTHTISVSASASGVTTGWQNISGIYALSDTVTTAVQTLISAVITDILTNSRTVPIRKSTHLTHSGAASDYEVLATAAEAFANGFQVATPVAEGTYARALQAYKSSGAAQLEFYIPVFAQNIPGMGSKYFTFGMTFTGADSSIDTDVVMQLITDIS